MTYEELLNWDKTKPLWKACGTCVHEVYLGVVTSGFSEISKGKDSHSALNADLYSTYIQALGKACRNSKKQTEAIREELKKAEAEESKLFSEFYDLCHVQLIDDELKSAGVL